MVVLGLILVVMAVAFAVGVLTGNGMWTPMEWYGLALDGLPGWSSYLAGLVTMLVLVVGLGLFRRGIARVARARQTTRHRRQTPESDPPRGT